MTTTNKNLSKKTRSNFNKIMRGARLFDLAKQSIQQPRLQDTSTQAPTMKQRRMHIDAEKANSDGVDVELPALKRRQLSPSGSHMTMDEEDDEEASLIGEEHDTLGQAFQKKMLEAKTARELRKYAPIAGNMYRYWAMSGGVFTWNKADEEEDVCDKASRMRKVFGMLTLLLIQVVAPPAVIVATMYKIEWDNVKMWQHDPVYIEGSAEYGVSWFTSRILGLAFITAFSLWSLDQIEGEKSDWLKLNSLLNFYESAEKLDSGYKTCYSPERFWLWMGPVINCLAYLGCGVAMILLLKVADSPKDVVFDSLSLLFLLKLDDLDSDLGFLDSGDWDGKEMGTYLYDYMTYGPAQDLFFNDGAMFPKGDPRDVDDPFDVDDPDTLVAYEATMVHPFYTLTRFALYCLNIAAVIFWFCAATVKEKDSPDITNLNANITSLKADITSLMLAASL